MTYVSAINKFNILGLLSYSPESRGNLELGKS